MSESSSGVNTSSGSFPKSHSSQYSELSVKHTPLSVEQSPDSGVVRTPMCSLTSAPESDQSDSGQGDPPTPPSPSIPETGGLGLLPWLAEVAGGLQGSSDNQDTGVQPHPAPESDQSDQLPSCRFRFVSWHRLEQSDVRGNQLTCPRVREGPPEEELIIREEGDVLLERWRRRAEQLEGQRWEERLQENWENCLELNLSYQDLGDPFQRDNFFRILRRLIRVEKLQLVDNSLTDLSSVCLPRCRVLNLQRNHLVCLRRQLPKLPALEHLCLSDNAIGSLGGLGAALGGTPLHSLTLSRNPVTFTQDYRARVFSCLPKLQVLDGIPKLPEDSLPPKLHFQETTSMCNIL